MEILLLVVLNLKDEELPRNSPGMRRHEHRRFRRPRHRWFVCDVFEVKKLKEIRQLISSLRIPLIDSDDEP